MNVSNESIFLHRNHSKPQLIIFSYLLRHELYWKKKNLEAVTTIRFEYFSTPNTYQMFIVYILFYFYKQPKQMVFDIKRFSIESKQKVFYETKYVPRSTDKRLIIVCYKTRKFDCLLHYL